MQAHLNSNANDMEMRAYEIKQKSIKLDANKSQSNACNIQAKSASQDQLL